jgi:SNF2 family DNA or RNA helicase
MPVFLKRKTNPDRLTVKLGGFDKRSEFDDALARVKGCNVPGRRFNRDTKDWEFPDDPETALRLMLTLEPVIDAATRNMVEEHRTQLSESIITGIGDDARLEHPALNHILFPYQRAFVEWALTHPHSILADEMGIGKTLQFIALVWEAEHRAHAGLPGPLDLDTYKLPSLVVAPNGLRKNYRDAIIHGPRDENQVPIYPDWPGQDCAVVILDGQNVGKRVQQIESEAEFFITNWEKLRSDAKLLQRRKWKAVCGSEAHRAKNRDAQQTKGFWKLQAPIQIAETGTPVMNSPDELWSLLAWLLPEQYAKKEKGGGFWAFHYAYVDEYATKHGHVMRGIKNVDQLRFELADKLVRRTKKQVLPDLPDKLPPKFVPVDLTKEERAFYTEVEEAVFLDIRKFITAEATRRFNAGTAATVEDEELVIAGELEHMPLARLERMLKGSRIPELRQITAMAKARIAVEIVRDNWQEPLVIFTWFVEPAKWIKDKLEGPHSASGAPRLEVGLIAGAGGPDPTETAQAFQRGDHDQIVCTISKGGTGLDLYRSSHAIFADRDWVPAINSQAVDRLHRQGQKNAVSTTILECPDTVDEDKVAPANRFKQGIVDALGFGE